MSFTEQLRAVRERWFLVVLALLVGIGCSAVTYLARPAEYTASLPMYVSAPGNQDPSSAALNGQLAQQRVKSYLELVSNREAAAEVVRTLGLAESPDDLLSRISASNPLDSVVLLIEVTDSTPQKAADEANAFGAVFGRMATDLDTRAGFTEGSNLTLRVVEPAAVPTAPSSPGIGLVMGLGLLGGLLVGVGGALVAHRLDRRVRNAEALGRISGLPVLGTLSMQKDLDREALLSDRAHPFSDDVRRLRAKLAAANGGEFPRSILVTSAQQGDGRTTVAVALALHLASIGKRVLLIDADLRRPRVDETLGLGPAAGLSSVLTGQSSLGQAIRSWNSGPLDVLSSGPVPEDPGPMLAGPGLRALISDMCAVYDVVLIDSSPVAPVVDAADMAGHVHTALMLGRPGSAISDVARAVRILEPSARRIIGAVLTMAPSSRSGSSQSYVADPASPLMSDGADRPVVFPSGVNGVSPGRPGQPGPGPRPRPGGVRAVPAGHPAMAASALHPADGIPTQPGPTAPDSQGESDSLDGNDLLVEATQSMTTSGTQARPADAAPPSGPAKPDEQGS